MVPKLGDYVLLIWRGRERVGRVIKIEPEKGVEECGIRPFVIKVEGYYPFNAALEDIRKVL